MGGFSHADIHWKNNTARHLQSRTVLECVKNFLTQEKPTRKGTLLDLILIKKKKCVGDMKVKGRPDCSQHEMVEFRREGEG